MKIFHKNIFRKLSIFFLSFFIILNINKIIAFPSNNTYFGSEAIKHIKYLSLTPRISGTRYIVSSQKYIKNEFQKYGYNVEEQNFIWPLKNSKYSSKNIIAYKKGLCKRQIIIGAHYDSTNTNGADDNASGVSVLLELSNKLSKTILPYSIKFIAFDAEEIGLFGSRHFVKNMSEEEKNNTILYINIDSILSGDDLYIYGNSGIRGWFKDEILELSKKENIDIKTSPGLKPTETGDVSILEGECYDYSDHVYFKQASIPFIYFESTSWDSIDKATGYPNYRNKNLGMVLHTKNDNLDYILNNLKNKPSNNLNNCLFLLYNTLIPKNNSITILTNTINTKEFKNIKYELYKNHELIDTYEGSSKITLNNLSKGKYRIKQVNTSNLCFETNYKEDYFELSKQGTMYILYNDVNSIPKEKDYDRVLVGIYGDEFDDLSSTTDDLYNEFIKLTNIDPKKLYNENISIEEIKKILNDINKNHEQSLPTFLNLNSKEKKLNYKNIYKIINSTLLTIICSNIYNGKSKSI